MGTIYKEVFLIIKIKLYFTGVIFVETIKFNKLVRDKIPELIEKENKIANIEKVKGEKLIEILNKKLDEELDEYRESGNIEELADLVEVIYGLVENLGITIKDFEAIRKFKAETKGSFKEGILLIEVREKGEI